MNERLKTARKALGLNQIYWYANNYTALYF
jgi:hypothetical protein